MNFNIKTEGFPDGSIVHEVSSVFYDVKSVLVRQVIQTQDAEVRRALIDMGWTPPGDGTTSLSEQLRSELFHTKELARKNAALYNQLAVATARCEELTLVCKEVISNPDTRLAFGVYETLKEAIAEGAKK